MVIDRLSMSEYLKVSTLSLAIRISSQGRA
jgi:hypothetical protein